MPRHDRRATSTVALVALVTTATAALTGCTHTGSAAQADSGPTPRPTVTSEPAVDGFVPPTGECIDGEATITTDLAEIALPDGCETVNLLTNGSTVTLGPVTTLTLEGANNTVTVASVENIHVYGDENSITHGGEPEVTDHGTKNEISTQ